jgi:formiminotetrahydrofolate cyclodeaminase
MATSPVGPVDISLRDFIEAVARAPRVWRRAARSDAACAQGLEVAATVAAHGVRAASADVQLAVAPLQAGSDGARSDLEAKLSSFTDAAYVTSVADEIVRLPGNSTASTRAAESLLKALPA